MIQINPLKSYIDGGVRAAITTPPSASLVFDLPGKAIWVKGVKLKGTDHTYTFSHDNYITLTNTSNSNESEDIKIGVNTSALKNAIDTTYGVVSTTTNGLAPKFTSENKQAASTATTYYFLGWTGSTLKWYQAPFRNVRINSETTDCLEVNNTDPLIISSGNGISVTWDSTNKKIVITNTQPDVNHNTDIKVAQNVTTQDKNYAVILKGNDSDEDSITTVNFSTYLKFNPYTKQLISDGEYYANGNQRLAHISEIPTSLKNPYALIISLNGISQGPYDGSAAKNIDITPGSIGAATSGHNHDGRYIYNYGDTQMDGASLNKNALGMTINSGITGDWWYILQAAWNSEYRWNSQIAFPTQNRNGMYYRSGLDDNTAWGAWIKLLDINNYSSILDTRYITDITTSTNILTFTRNGSNINKDITVNVIYSQGNLTNISNEDNTTKASPGLLIYNSYSQIIGTNSYSSVLSINTGGTIQIAGDWGDDQTRNLYWRSQSDRDVTSYPWKSWRTILDNENYPSILDSRYYTESEINNFLANKLDRVNLTTGNWNPRGYNLAADYQYNGGDLSISESGSQIHVSVDGYFWQNEGQYRVLDTSDITELKNDLIVHQYLSDTDTTWWPLIWGGGSHNNTSDSIGAVYKSHDKLSWQTSSQTLYATNLYTGRLDTKGNHYYRFNSDATLRIYGSPGDNTERIYFQVGIDNRMDDYDIPSYGGEQRHSIILNPRGGFVGIGDTNPSYKLSVGGDIGIGGNIYISHSANDNMNYNTSNPRIVFSENGNQAVGLVYTDYDSYRPSKGLKVMDVDNNDPSNVWFEVQGYNYSSGYVKNGSNDNYVLLGGGGHKLESSLNVTNADTVDGEHANNFSYTHQTSFDFSKSKSGRIVTFDQQSTDYGWINGFASTHSNYLTSIIFNTHRTSNWYVGYMEANTSTGETNGLQAIHQLAFIDSNVASATKLQIARNLWGNFFNGTTDISSTIRFNNVTSGLCEGIQWTCGDNDFARINAGATGSNAGYLEIATADDGNEPIYVRQYSGVFNSVVRTLTLLDANGFSHFPSYINIGGNENNNYSPDRVWGSNGSDSYLRSYRTSALSVAYASNSDMLDGYHESSFLRYREVTNIDQEVTLWNQIGIKEYQGALPDGLANIYNYGSVISLSSLNCRFEIYASHLSSNGNGLYYRSGWSTDKRTWLKFIDSSNIGSQSVNYATSAGNADTVDGYHATTGRTFNGNINWSDNWNDVWSDGTNSHPWYGFDHRYPNTGAYSTTIADFFGMTIKTANTLRLDFSTLLINGTNIYDINVASATKLQTTRTIWGQFFDGTANVDNTLRIRQTTGNYCEGIRIQTGDGTWATIILGATGDSGTNANAWSIHRKADNNFAISRNSSDGINGLVMTSVGMGLGTTTPTHRLDVRGDTKITGSIRDLAIGGGIYWNPYVESTTDGSDAASITVVRSGIAGGTTLVLSQMNDANDTIQFQTNSYARLYHNSYPILTTQNTYVSNSKGYINDTEITYVNNAYTAYSASKLDSTGYADNGLSYYQTNGDFDGSTGWAHYIIANHGNGASYYHYTIKLPFWSVPQYRRQMDGTSNVTSWYDFITAENIGSQSVNYATSSGNADTVDGYHASAFATVQHTHNYAANENYGGFTKSGRLPISGFYQSVESESGGNAPWPSWMHLINCQHSNTDNNYALQIAASFFDNNTFKIRVTNNSINNDWRDIIHSGNIGSQTVANTYHLYINSINAWSTWYWAGQSDQPNWLWGSNDGVNMYVWNPSNFSVYKANKSDQLEAYTSWGFTDGGHFVRAIRYSGWHTRLYMGYYRDATLQNTVHVGYADDADTLDGNHASSFALVGHTHNYDNVYSKLGHTHDDRYYTESEINSKLSAYLPLAGGTMTGQIKGNNKGGSWIQGRANAALYQPRNVQGDWHPVVGFKTKTGSWEFGSVGYDDNASFSWESDTNYNSGTNTTTVVYLRNTSGTIALTSEIPTVTNYYWANIKVSSTSNSNTSPTFSTCYTSNWFRSTGQTGWYSETYAGGWYMTDTTWVRTYNSKGIYTDTGTIYNLGHAWLACNNGYNVGIGTTSPSYKLHVSGDSYATGWSRAASGFYCQDTGVHFTHNGTKGQITITSNNEFCWGAKSNILYFNYATASQGTTVTSYVWNAGSSTSYASHTLGTLTSKSNIYAVHFYESSDIRQKTDFSSLNISTEELSTIPLFNFSWKNNLSSRNTGTSAQVVQSILPNIVTQSDNYLKLDYGVLGTIAGITACKELVKVNIEISTQKSEIEQLKEKVKQLEDKLRKYTQL